MATREIPLVIDLDGEIYLRQERKGVLLGVYEKNATPWALGGTPWDYGETELLPPNIDRLTDALAKVSSVFRRSRMRESVASSTGRSPSLRTGTPRRTLAGPS